MIKKNLLLTIFLILSITKIILIFYIGESDRALFSEGESNEWGTIYLNLKNNQVMSWFSTEEILFPTGFMPPLYIYYIYILSFLSETYHVKVILFSQLILSLLTSFIFFKLCLKKLDLNQSIFACILFSFYPINLYGATQISSVTIVLFIYTSFLYLAISHKNIILISLIAGFGILARGEFKYLYFFFLIYLFLFKNIKLKKIILSLFITLIIISPHLIRNYNIFDKIFITHSAGYVLWRGNNELSTVTSIKADQLIGTMERQMLRTKNKNQINNSQEQPDQFKNIISELELIKTNVKYDILRDDIFKKYAIQNIKNNFPYYFKQYLKKFLSFSFFNIKSDYPNYYHPLSILPEIIISIGAVVGLILTFREYKKFIIFYIYVIFLLSIYSLLLILPRYKLFLLPCYIPFFTIFIFRAMDYLKKNFFN